MANGTIKQLTTPGGLSALSDSLSDVSSYYNEPENLAAVKQTVQSFIRANPDLANVGLKVQPGIHGAYHPEKDYAVAGVINPAVVGHELGHAKNLRKTRLYNKILQAARGVASVNNVVALPAMLSLRAFVDDENTRNEVLNILSGTSAAVAAPGLVEELSASIEAMKHAPNKWQATKTLGPAFLQHAAHALMPTALYQLGKHI